MTMNRLFWILPVLLLALPASAQEVDLTSTDVAVLPLPEDMRAGAAVLGFDDDGRLVTVREGSNAMICIADDPAIDRFHVACYHNSLEPFMERGRALRAQGHDRDAIASMRKQEIEDGTLAFPSHPTALYSLTGEYDSILFDEGEVRHATRLHVVYTPYATLEQTGLPPRAPRGQPWLMDPGEPWAHIMFVQVDTP
jgi:hypothetical protein